MDREKIENLDLLDDKECAKECINFLYKDNPYLQEDLALVLESINKRVIDNSDDNENIFYPVLEHILFNFGNVKNTLLLALGALSREDDDEKAFELIDTFSDDDAAKIYLTVTYYYGKDEIDLCYDLINDHDLYDQYPRLCYSVAIKLFAKDAYQSAQIISKLTNVQDKALRETFLPLLNNQLYDYNRISLVVAVKNRTENLLNCFPSGFNIDLIGEYIIVDFSSDEPLTENATIKSWMDSYNVKVVRVDGEKQFNLGKAYNLAFDYAENNNVLKIDADYINIDSSWLEQFAIRQPESNYFIHGHFDFGFHLSGLCFMKKHVFSTYREDLSGYGYDEVDMYQRCKDQGAKPILFFDATKYVKHMGHSVKSRSSEYKSKDIQESEVFNRELCQKYNTQKPLRNEYSIDNGIVTFDNKRISDIFCINLDKRADRWEEMKVLSNAQRFSAVDAKSNPMIYKEFNIDLAPIDISSKLYFKFHPGAVGAFLSHYNVWKHIVDQDLEHAMVLEDDVDPTSVLHILESNVIFKGVDFVQLSRRIRKVDDKNVFDGGESYIISKEGAEKLINAVHFPLLLDNVAVDKFKEVQNLCQKQGIEDPNIWPNLPSITCPVDKLMGYCCQNAASDLCRLSYVIYPFVKLNEETSTVSDINETNNSWAFSEQKINHLIKTGVI